METRQLGNLWPVSELTLGGGGLAQVWGETSPEEALATLKAGVDAGITLFDVAPIYGRGEAERLIGEAFGGKPPTEARFTTKCFLGSPEPDAVAAKLERSLTRSLETMKLDRIDLFFLHTNICPDDYVYEKSPDNQDRFATRWSIYENEVVPAFEALKARGLIGDWGITGTGLPVSIMQALRADVRPAAVQVVTNLLDSAGNMRRFDEPAEPRNILRTAINNDVGVLGIRAVQAGALTAALDREAAPEEQADYEKALPFRTLCGKWGVDPAVVAHQYALAMPGVASVILGVKNRRELADIVSAVESGPIDAELKAAIDALRLNFQIPRMPID
jgi:aryl-alcohol dehydrogenase-like predicted oxidoreductase